MLFLSDLSKFKHMGFDPAIDYRDNNPSFLRVAELYQKMGIANHYFPLVVLQKELLDIDPWDRHICNMLETSKEVLSLRAMILKECQNNIWYHFRHVFKVKAKGAPDRIPFKLSRGVCSLYWLLENHIDAYLELPRQEGKSFATAGYIARCMSLFRNGNYGLLSKDRKLTGDYAKYIENFLTGVPAYMMLYGKFDSCNSELVTLKKLDNQLHLLVCKENDEDAKNVGRGLAINGLTIDEGNYQANLDKTLPSLSVTGKAAKESARLANAPYFTIMTTTAGNLNTDAGKYGRKLFDESLPFNEKFYDLQDEHELRDIIAKNNLARMRARYVDEGKNAEELKVASSRVLVSLGYKECGYDDDWYDAKKVEFNFTSEEEAQCELNNVWISSGGSDVLSVEEARILKEARKEVVYLEITPDNYTINWYIPEEEVIDLTSKRQIVMGVDPSNALNGDSFPFVILDTDTGEVLATAFYAQTNLSTLNDWFCKWFDRFPNNFVMVIENRSSGAALIDTIIRSLTSKGINPLNKIFNWVVDEYGTSNKKVELYKDSNRRLHDLTFFAGIKREIGFTTSSSGRNSRDKLYGEAFREYLKHSAKLANDKTLIDEFFSLTKKTGKIEAEKGKHDDAVVACLLAFWFLTFAKNKAMYGLDTTRVLRKAVYSTLGEEGVRKQQLQYLEDMKIKELDELIQNSRDEFTAEYYKKLKQKYVESLTYTNEDVFNLDLDTKNVSIERNRTNYGGDRGSIMSSLLGR